MPTVSVYTAEQVDELIEAKIKPLAEAIARLSANDPQQPEKPVDPVEPEPEPEQPELPIAATAQLQNSNGGEWEKGISKLESRFLLRDTPEAKKAFAAGNSVKFNDGSLRKIVSVTAMHNALYVKVEGDKLSPTLGYPNTVAAVKGDEQADPEGELSSPKPEPVPGKRVGVMGTAIGMGMGYPQLVPGVMGQHWQLPTEDDIVRAKSYGLTLLRVGSLRERLIRPGGKHELYLGEKDALPNIVKVCRLAKKHGCLVMTDLFHNYGGFSETDNAIKGGPGHKKIGTPSGPSYDTFAYDSKAIIQYLQTDPDCWDAIYGIDTMNEWVGLPGDNVFFAHQRFLDVCGPIMGAKMAILEGNAYSNTPNFWDHNPRFKDLKDPRGKGFIEMSGHLYSDQDMSGSYKTGDTVRAGQTFEGVFRDKVKPFLDGCDKYGFHASIGEWVVPGDHPRLLEGTGIGIEYALSRGCNVIAFGMGRGYSTQNSNHWNLEIARNKPTLDMIKRITGVSA